MPKIIRDDYVTHLVMNRSEIEEIKVLYGDPKFMSEWYNEFKPDAMINGALFDFGTGIPIETFKSDGVLYSESSWCRKGMGIDYNKSIKFGDFDSSYKDFIVGFPVLIDNGKIDINFDVGSSLKSAHPRSVFSVNDNEILITSVDGRQEGKPGMTIKRLSEYMQMMGVTNSINLDGGGSTRLMLGNKVLNSPSENRKITSIIAIWFKRDVKEDKGNDSMKICLDYGHNNSSFDTGASYYGYKEQDITFSIGKLVKDGLERHGISVVETRPVKEKNLGTSLNSSLNTRVQIANDAKVDYFISIHCNANTNTTAHGTETYIQGTGGKAEKLAKAVNDSLVSNVGTYNRGVKVQNLAVTRLTSMPAILIETAFLSNQNDCNKLINRQQDIADGIVKGVCKYLNITYKENKPKEPVKQPNKYSYDDTVEKMVVKGFINVDYMIPWEKALINNQELRTVLEKYIK